MPSVVPLDHQQSRFSMLFNSQLRVLHCPIYDLDNLDACALHAKYYGMCMGMCITLLSRRCSCTCTPKWSTTIYLIHSHLLYLISINKYFLLSKHIEQEKVIASCVTSCFAMTCRISDWTQWWQLLSYDFCDRQPHLLEVDYSHQCINQFGFQQPFL